MTNFKNYSAAPYTLAFSDTHMKISYTYRGRTFVETFELHRVKPDGVFASGTTMTVTTGRGSVFAYGCIVTSNTWDDVRFVAWPV